MTFFMKNKIYISLVLLAAAACRPISSEYTYIVDNQCNDTIQVNIIYWDDSTEYNMLVLPNNSIVLKHLNSADYFNETFFYPTYLIKSFEISKNGRNSNINYLSEYNADATYWECTVKWIRFLSIHGVEYRVKILDEHF